MRILKIELEGFKSFARPTFFEFHANITGVVGPNGCGKSNVVDAVRWVLGEASRKALRTKSNVDVIFSGSAVRKPSRKAEVSITFDNSDRTITHASRRVKVTRRLHKNGDNEYLINDEHVKLREVRALFHGTGAAMSAYSIMEQGKMDRLLTSNPEERRRVFEEAAGIGRLRKQQQQAEAKLEIVAQNLIRLKDVLNEVRGRLRKIKGQASRALRYTEFKERARVVHLSLALDEFHKLNQSREELLEGINQAGAREGAVQAEVAKVRMDLEEAETNLTDAEREDRRLGERLHKLELRVNEQSARRENASTRIESLGQAIERAREDCGRVRTQIALLKERREEIAATAGGTRESLATMASQLAELTAEEAELTQSANELEAELKQTRERLLEAIGRANDGLNERLTLEADIRFGSGRQETLTLRGTQVGRELKQVAGRKEAAEKASTAEKKRLKALRDEMAKVERKSLRVEAAIADLRQKKHAIELKREAGNERKTMLETMAAAHEGLDENARGLLEDAERSRSFGILGLFADKVRVDLAFAAGLERVLERVGAAMVVDTLEHAHDLFDWLAGRGSTNVSILARDEFKPPKAPQFPGGKGVIGPLANELRIEKGFEALVNALIGDVLLVADRSVARALIRRGSKGVGAQPLGLGARPLGLGAQPLGLRLVTPTGELFELPGSFSLAAGDGATGLITQQSEIDRLGLDLKNLDARLSECAGALQVARDEGEVLQTRETDLRPKIYDGSMAIAERKADLEIVCREQARLAEELEVLEAERATVNKQVGEDRKRHAELTDEVSEAVETKSGCEKALDHLIGEASTRRGGLGGIRAKLTEASVSEARLRTQLEQSEDSLQGIDDALTRYAEDIARTAAEEEREAAQIRTLEEECRTSLKLQGSLERELKELEDRRLSGDGTLMLIRTSVEEFRGKVESLQEKLYAERESVQQARIDENTLYMKMDAVRGRMAETCNADLDTLYREYNHETDRIETAAAKVQLEALQEQIRRLGNVNMEAMDELSEAQERSTFFSRQETDLVRARRTLAEAIGRIERETKRLFIETFEGVRKNFHRLFRRLFGGGSADILLSNPEDPLNSGVDIIARPPGKEALPIAMRSGGERALISVAMMFAIYETNPAPFAILDEVDAPLDDANVDRFCAVIADYAKLSQFIIITHHKKTMSSCDLLYGVTMQEPGVSSRVSVDLRTTQESAT